MHPFVSCKACSRWRFFHAACGTQLPKHTYIHIICSMRFMWACVCRGVLCKPQMSPYTYMHLCGHMQMCANSAVAACLFDVFVVLSTSLLLNIREYVGNMHECVCEHCLLFYPFVIFTAANAFQMHPITLAGQPLKMCPALYGEVRSRQGLPQQQSELCTS